MTTAKIAVIILQKEFVVKNAIIFILSFIVVAMGLCLCQPSENTNTNTIKKPEFNYNFNYTIPEYKEQNEQPTFNYDFLNDYEEDTNFGRCACGL